MDCLVKLLYLARLLEGAEEGDRLLSARRHPVLNVSTVMYCIVAAQHFCVVVHT
jgi:hypothetical protein